MNKNVSTFSLHLLIDAGYLYSILEIEESLTIYDVIDETSYNFKANNFYIDPSVSIEFPLNRLLLAFKTGYQIDLYKGAFKLSSNKDDVLQNNKGNET
ncbi:MAG: hypothetical protein JEZ09_07600 [Salinivirgaceae bacterium]|nr:hypothetical protein [Salinivirgaceae bacterium]